MSDDASAAATPQATPRAAPSQQAMPRPPLNGSLIRITPVHDCAMITLRGDLDSPAIVAALRDGLGVAVPAPRRIAQGDAGVAAWMSPDELLLMPGQGGAVAALADLRARLAGQHFLAEDVSDARAVFDLTGEDAALREVLAKLSPADLSPAAFGPGDICRTRLAQAAAGIWCPAPGHLRLVCFRSVAVYMSGLLENAAAAGGQVDFYPRGG